MSRMILSLVFVLSFIVSAQAEEPMSDSAPAFRVECLPEIGRLSVRKYYFTGHNTIKRVKENWQELAEKHDIHYLKPMIELKDCRLIKKEVYVKNCRFGEMNIEIVVTPYQGNSDGYKNCCGYVSNYLTIKVDGKVIVDNLLFNRCNYMKEYVDEVILEDVGNRNNIHVLGSGFYFKSFTRKDFVPLSDKVYYKSDVWEKVN